MWENLPRDKSNNYKEPEKIMYMTIPWFTEDTHLWWDRLSWLPVISESYSVQFSRSAVSDSATSWTTAYQASLSITNSQSPPKPMSIESVMLSNHLILCRPLLLLPSIFPSIRVFSNVSSSYQVAKVLEFQLQHQSFQRTPRTDFF